MANTLKFGSGQWATKVGSTLAYNDENGNFKPLPFNFTRSTSGTRVNKDGLIEVVTNNKPRIDFLNDSNGALLLEPQRSNLALYSNDLSNAAWDKSYSTITSNAAISPDGTTNANKVVETTDTGLHRAGQGAIAVTSGQVYTFSFYAKAAERNELELQRINTSGTVFNNISVTTADLILGTLSVGLNVTSSSINSVGDGWYRISLSLTAIATGSGGLNIGMQKDGNVSYLGDGTSGVYIYGFQAEQGSYATSYIPTQGATAGVTRVAEVCNQTPPSGIIGQTEGTIFAHFKRNGNIVSRGGVVFLREDFLRGLSINYINNTLYAISRNDAATTTVVLKTPFDINETAKVAITYNGSVFSGFLNGVKIFTDSVFNPFDTIVTEIRVSYGANSGSDIEIAPNSMKDVRVYTTVLTDQECINLTTL
jgi:hypothetical protein